MKCWSQWTETAINKHLDGKFFQLQQKSLGTAVVIDLNEPEEEPEPPAVAMVPIETATPLPDGSLRIDDIARIACNVFGVTKLELKSQRRNGNIVAARQVFFWIAKRYTDHSFPFIGAWIGRDHTTVMHGVWKIDHRFNEYLPNIELCLSRLGVSLNMEEAA